MPEPDCPFCAIVAGRLPAEILHEDDRVVAFRDIHPQAPLHVLVIPRRHVRSLDAVGGDDRELLGHLLHVAARLARDLGVAERGYRTVLNCNGDGGQTVWHLHLHLLAGRPMGWPPG